MLKEAHYYTRISAKSSSGPRQSEPTHYKVLLICFKLIIKCGCFVLFFVSNRVAPSMPLDCMKKPNRGVKHQSINQSIKDTIDVSLFQVQMYFSQRFCVFCGLSGNQKSIMGCVEIIILMIIFIDSNTTGLIKTKYNTQIPHVPLHVSSCFRYNRP